MFIIVYSDRRRRDVRPNINIPSIKWRVYHTSSYININTPRRKIHIYNIIIFYNIYYFI